MRDAAVGFQCPNCVHEGAKQTRSGRTAYGGELSKNPALTSMTLIGINAFVWLLALTSGGSHGSVVRQLSLWRETVTLDPRNGQPYTVDGVADGAYWQLLTSAFVHVEPWHIGFNMLALWFLGPQLELAIGRARFIALYVGSALAGSTMVYWFTPIYTYTLGASGAIFGLMAALLILAIKVRGNTQEILTWIGINALITVVGRGFISWEGHLGGFLGGLALMVLIAYAPRQRRTWWQASGFVLFALVLAGLIVVRTSALA